MPATTKLGVGEGEERIPTDKHKKNFVKGISSYAMMGHSRNGFTKATSPKKNLMFLNLGTVAWYGPARLAA
jgi:hypothetical protein